MTLVQETTWSYSALALPPPLTGLDSVLCSTAGCSTVR